MLKCRLKLNKNNKNVKDGAWVPNTWYFKFSSKMVTKFIMGVTQIYCNLLDEINVPSWYLFDGWFSLGLVQIKGVECWEVKVESY
jgi:hypothetical protein